MSTTILMIFGILIFTFVSIAAGYKLAVMRWQPKDMIDKLDKYNAINKELSDGIKKLDDINNQKDTWYIQQLNNLGHYMKEKYNDSYVYDQLKSVPGYQKPEQVEQKEYEVDDILDKASKNGFDSLTEEEINYLKNSGNND